MMTVGLRHSLEVLLPLLRLEELIWVLRYNCFLIYCIASRTIWAYRSANGSEA